MFLLIRNLFNVWFYSKHDFYSIQVNFDQLLKICLEIIFDSNTKMILTVLKLFQTCQTNCLMTPKYLKHYNFDVYDTKLLQFTNKN